MASVLHRINKIYITSADTPEYPIVDWIHNPNLSAVAGFASKYWIITGDVVTLMDQAARDAVDAAELTTYKNGESDTADTSVGSSNESVWQGFREIIASQTRTHNKLANRIREIERALNDVKNTSGGSDNIRAAIPLPSAEVIAEGAAPGTFTNLQNRLKSSEIADFRQTLRDLEGQV